MLNRPVSVWYFNEGFQLAHFSGFCLRLRRNTFLVYRMEDGAWAWFDKTSPTVLFTTVHIFLWVIIATILPKVVFSFHENVFWLGLLALGTFLFLALEKVFTAAIRFFLLLRCIFIFDGLLPSSEKVLRIELAGFCLLLVLDLLGLPLVCLVTRWPVVNRFTPPRTWVV
jgi:hypothetical protein